MRRDNCQLVRTVVSTCLDRILIEEDIEGAKEYVRSTISDLLMNRLDLSLLVITKVGPPLAIAVIHPPARLHRAPSGVAVCNFSLLAWRCIVWQLAGASCQGCLHHAGSEVV